MGIQVGIGPVRIDPDDVQIMHRGITLALKLRVMDGIASVGLFRKPAGQAWDHGTEIVGFDDTWTPAFWAPKMGEFLALVCERVNEWLAQWFPPGETPPDALAEWRPFESALTGLQFVPQPDGTLKLSAPE